MERGGTREEGRRALKAQSFGVLGARLLLTGRTQLGCFWVDTEHREGGL